MRFLTITTILPFLLLAFFTFIDPVSSKWEYIPPLYACSPTISGCSSNGHQCLANPNHPQSTTDAECYACGSDQKYWPCDVDGLCYCWDESRPKIPPAPSTRTYKGGKGLNVSDVDPCSLLTPEVFEKLAPQAGPPYSYAGFCTAVRKYNENHPDEGVFNMGTPRQQRHELAAFFGNALHESDEFRAGREYLMCADRIEMGGEVYCRPCDAGSFDWDNMKCPSGASLASEGRAFNSYCQSNLLPPEGCMCDDVYERSDRGPMAGFVKANQVYFGRGSIQLSWNYNYIRASVALTGAEQTFCQRPDLVATNEEYAWGAGLFYWMENVKNDKTCHQSVLLNDEFGATLENINGGLECPADDHGWHGKAIVLRLNRYCRAATALDVGELLSLDGCMDMEKRMRQCLGDGSCKDCNAWEKQFAKSDEPAAAVDGGSNGNGGKNKDKNKDKDKDKDKQNNGAVGGNSKGSKEKDKGKDKQEAAADTGDGCKEKDKGKNKQETAAATGDAAEDLMTEETPKPTGSPTRQPTHQPRSRLTRRPVMPDPTGSPTEDPRAPCTGEPCPVPRHVRGGFEFCRSADGVCGAGPQYCNSRSTWTAFCHDCDVDSKYGCPTFGCDDCHGEERLCVGNPNARVVIDDGDCRQCGMGVVGGVGQTFWPCDKVGSGGCWCWDTALPRVEPSPPSGFELGTTASFQGLAGEGVCADLLDKSTFQLLAPNSVSPFTYHGFCHAVDHYNSRHAEKVFRMGSRQQRLGELAAFLGMASHETNGFVAPREYLVCGDNVAADGELYCKPCGGDDYDYTTHTCGASVLSNNRSYMNYCQPYTAPPNGCSCEYLKEVEPSGPLQGRVKANEIFFGRGAVRIMHNFNYIRASASMTGSEDTFCERPELLAEVDSYAWGVGLYIWMEHVKEEGRTCHTHALDGNFGAMLDIINGGSECPVDEQDDSGEWYAEAVNSRLNHYCHAARVVGVMALLSFDGCDGLQDAFSSCLDDGSCPRCEYWDLDFVRTVPPIMANVVPLTNDSLTDRPRTYYPTTAMPTTPSPPPTESPIVVFTANEDDGATKSEVSSATQPLRTRWPSNNPATSHPTKSPTTRAPTPLPTSKPTPNPTLEPTPNPTPRPLSSLASHFGAAPTTPLSEPAVAKDPPAVESLPNSSSHASQFAAMTHSKGRYNSAVVATVTRPKPSASPTERPNVSYASEFGGMTNWANTKLDHPPSLSPIVAPAVMSDAHTPLPARLPINKPVEVINITENFHPKLNRVEDKSKEFIEQSEAINEAKLKKGLGGQPDTDRISKNEQDGSDVHASTDSLESFPLEGGEETTTSYHTKLYEGSFVFSPMDDVTISRSFPSTNFGSEPSVVVDMLEGDATLLRFDLSAVGDDMIRKATLKLTAAHIVEEGAGGATGVYYIQPTVNGWTEEGVTYDTAPKADGPLFASVASRISGDDDSAADRYELDVTDVAANHVISFRVMGTDRARKEFGSKEGSRTNNAPALLVEVESPPVESGLDTTTTSTIKPSLGAVMDKAAVDNMTSDNSNKSSPSTATSSGSIYGLVWLDRNHDGVKESNEPGLRGILVDLHQCEDGMWLEGTRTSPGGEYIFGDLDVEGRYYVVITTGSGEYGFTEKDAAIAAHGHARVSNVDPATGHGECIELLPTMGTLGNGQIFSASVNAGIAKMSTPQVFAAETVVEAAESVAEATIIPHSPNTTASESEDETTDSSVEYNCRGKPCLEGDGYCRSKYNFCGVGNEYCNEDSQWTAECGTPSPSSLPSAAPTTGQPTFLHDPDVHCAGEPCNDGDGTWCRSEIGYCGSGLLYCNVDSSWMPVCNGVAIVNESSSAPPTKSPIAPSFSSTGLPTASKMVLKTTDSSQPTLSPMKDGTIFSSFALPTLSQIVTPKQTDIGAATRLHSEIEMEVEDERAATRLHSEIEMEVEDEQSFSFRTDASSVIDSSSPESVGQPTETPMQSDLAEEKPWYVRYADVDPISRNVGSQSMVGNVGVLFSVAILLLLFL